MVVGAEVEITRTYSETPEDKDFDIASMLILTKHDFNDSCLNPASKQLVPSRATLDSLETKARGAGFFICSLAGLLSWEHCVTGEAIMQVKL